MPYYIQSNENANILHQFCVLDRKLVYTEAGTRLKKSNLDIFFVKLKSSLTVHSKSVGLELDFASPVTTDK